MPDWVTTWMLTTMAAAGTALGVLLSLLAAIELSKELRKWFRPATYPDIVSPELYRDLLESVDRKATRLIEMLEKEQEETDSFQWLTDTLKGTGEWLPLTEKESVAGNLTGTPYEASTAGQVEYPVFGAEYDPAWQVEGPLPVSIPFPVGDNHQQEWEEYLKSLGEGSLTYIPTPNQSSVSKECPIG